MRLTNKLYIYNKLINFFCKICFLNEIIANENSKNIKKSERKWIDTKEGRQSSKILKETLKFDCFFNSFTFHLNQPNQGICDNINIKFLSKNNVRNQWKTRRTSLSITWRNLQTCKRMAWLNLWGDNGPLQPQEVKVC